MAFANAIVFQVGCTSHHRATKTVGMVKMIDLMAMSTPKSANDPTSANILTVALLCTTCQYSLGLLVAGG
jgi:hypothetical protein